MASIVKIKDSSGEVQYPITKPEAVIDENGKNVLQLIQENGSSYDDTEIRTELARLEKDKADKSELTELSAEIGRVSAAVESKVDAEFVHNAIAEEIDNALTEEY